MVGDQTAVAHSGQCDIDRSVAEKTVACRDAFRTKEQLQGFRERPSSRPFQVLKIDRSKSVLASRAHRHALALYRLEGDLLELQGIFGIRIGTPEDDVEAVVSRALDVAVTVHSPSG